MNRGDFKMLADLRIREVKVLLDGGGYEGACYLPRLLNYQEFDSTAY
jgi:hypothetical protein